MNASWKALLACGLMAFASLTLGATYTVTNLADAGPGTLREQITRANSNIGRDTIRFTAGLSGTISLASTLPKITDDLTIDGTGASISISGNDRVRILFSVKPLTLMRLTFVRGRLVPGDTGPGNPGLGAAVLFDIWNIASNSNLIVIDCTFLGNNAVPDPPFSSGGGAIASRNGILTIRGSTFGSNSAISGGAIHIFQDSLYGETPNTITNSTFTDNSAYMTSGLETTCLRFCGGGAIYNFADRNLVLTHVTFQSNSVAPLPFRGSALWDANGRVTTIRNSIVSAAPGSEACAFVPSSTTGVVGAAVDAGGNLSSDASCGFTASTSVNGTDPMLGSLRDNGGPTPTMALLTGSPGIDAGVNALATLPDGSPLTTDQRGLGRRFGASVDKGAYERAGLLDFTGPFFPIFNWPIFNEAWAGSLLPVRFGLNGYQGMAVFAQGFPTTAAVACGSGPFTPVAELAQSGGGTLTYDTKTQRYQYVLASQAAWKGTCRKLSLKFTDGSSIDTFFRFK